MYEDVVCMFHANLNSSIKDTTHSSICQKLLVIAQEDIVRFLNVYVGEDKIAKIGKEKTHEAILEHFVESKLQCNDCCKELEVLTLLSQMIHNSLGMWLQAVS